MRTNSGDDEGRNQNLNPKMRDRERELGKSGSAVLDPEAREADIEANAGQRTTGMGSDARKSGQEGEAD